MTDDRTTERGAENEPTARDETETTETRHTKRRTFLTALAGVAGLGGISMADESLLGGREESTQAMEEPMRAIRLSARARGWRGGTPKAISGQTNPTLELRAGTTYELAWKNASDGPQNFAFRDSNGRYLPVIRVPAARRQGRNTTTETVTTGTTDTVDNFTRGTVDNFTNETANGFFNDTTDTTGCPSGVRRRIRNRLNDTTGTVGTFTNETRDGFNETDGGFFNETTSGRFNGSRGNRLTDTTDGGFFNETTNGRFNGTTGTVNGFFNGTTDDFFTGATVCPGGRRRRGRNNESVTYTTDTTVENRVAQTGVVRQVGEVQRLRFVAVEEMAEYVSPTRPERLVGSVEVAD